MKMPLKGEDGGRALNSHENYIVDDTLCPRGWGQKDKLYIFLRVVMLHIKLKQIFCPQTHPRPSGWGQKVKLYLFSESSRVAYQIKGNWAQSTMKANSLSLHTPTTPGAGSKGHFF